MNAAAQRKTMALYKAPVVKERYKRVISHFKKPKNSYNGTRLEPMVKSGNDRLNLQVLAESKDDMRLDSEADEAFGSNQVS